MAEGDGTVYNSFKHWVMEGAFDLSNGNDAVAVTLHTSYTPDVDSHTVWTDVSGTEYGSGSGYTPGGITLANQDTTVVAASGGKFDADNATWSSLGPLTPATPSHAIMWDNTHASDALIAYWELGTTATNGGNYTLAWHTNGILTIT